MTANESLMMFVYYINYISNLGLHLSSIPNPILNLMVTGILVLLLLLLVDLRTLTHVG